MRTRLGYPYEEASGGGMTRYLETKRTSSQRLLIIVSDKDGLSVPVFFKKHGTGQVYGVNRLHNRRHGQSRAWPKPARAPRESPLF